MKGTGLHSGQRKQSIRRDCVEQMVKATPSEGYKIPTTQNATRSLDTRVADGIFLGENYTFYES
jgi:hypothetical protein